MGLILAALGRVNAYGAIGDLLGPLTLAGAAALGISWRGVFLFGAVLMLLYAAWVAAQPFPRPPRSPAAEPPVAAILAVVRDRRILVLAVTDGLFGLLDEPFLGFTIAYLERVRGLPVAAATAIASVVVAAGIVGFLAVPIFTRRLATGWLLLMLAALIAFAVPALAALQATYLGLRPGQAGTTQAVVSTFGLLGVGFPALVGVATDTFGLTAGMGLYTAVPVAILLTLALDGPWRWKNN